MNHPALPPGTEDVLLVGILHNLVVSARHMARYGNADFIEVPILSNDQKARLLALAVHTICAMAHKHGMSDTEVMTMFAAQQQVIREMQ